MKKLYSTIMLLAMMVAALSLTACGGDDEEGDGGITLKQDYDILQVNGVDYACYGYRCDITFSSTWNKTNHSGEILLPCGKLSDAKKGEYDYDYMYGIKIEGSKELKKGSKLEDYSLRFDSSEDYYHKYNFTSGSATVVDIRSDEYITIKFESFMVSNKDGNSYVLNGTVQLDFDVD
jgi:hypothetical protein